MYMYMYVYVCTYEAYKYVCIYIHMYMHIRAQKYATTSYPKPLKPKRSLSLVSSEHFGTCCIAGRRGTASGGARN